MSVLIDHISINQQFSILITESKFNNTFLKEILYILCIRNVLFHINLHNNLLIFIFDKIGDVSKG